MNVPQTEQSPYATHLKAQEEEQQDFWNTDKRTRQEASITPGNMLEDEFSKSAIEEVKHTQSQN